jgi:hypothetical protein
MIKERDCLNMTNSSKAAAAVVRRSTFAHSRRRDRNVEKSKDEN